MDTATQRKLAFVSLKGGVGKTTLAVHAAWYLHEIGHAVTLVDGDPIESGHDWHTLGEPFPFRVIYPDEPWPADGWLVFDTEAHPERKALEALADNMDIAIIPVTCNLDAINAAIKTLPALEGRRAKVLAVVNAAPPNNLPDGENVRQTLEEAGIDVCKTILHGRKAIEYARLEGVPVFKTSQSSRMKAWLELTTFYGEVLSRGL